MTWHFVSQSGFGMQVAPIWTASQPIDFMVVVVAAEPAPDIKATAKMHMMLVRQIDKKILFSFDR
jgi:hypothetical protein